MSLSDENSWSIPHSLQAQDFVETWDACAIWISVLFPAIEVTQSSCSTLSATYCFKMFRDHRLTGSALPPHWIWETAVPWEQLCCPHHPNGLRTQPVSPRQRNKARFRKQDGHEWSNLTWREIGFWTIAVCICLRYLILARRALQHMNDTQPEETTTSRTTPEESSLPLIRFAINQSHQLLNR